MKKALSIFLLILSNTIVFCQSPSFKYFDRESGLPTNTIYCSFQDQQGFMWFGTDNGVLRYDGYDFETFLTGDGLSDNEVFNIYEDRQGRLWFLTYNGKLSYYKDGQFYNESNTPFLKDLQASVFFQNVLEDQQGRLWFAPLSGGIFLLTKENKVHHLLKNNGYLKAREYKGDIYLSTDHHLFKFHSVQDVERIMSFDSFIIDPKGIQINDTEIFSVFHYKKDQKTNFLLLNPQERTTQFLELPGLTYTQANYVQSLTDTSFCIGSSKGLFVFHKQRPTQVIQSFLNNKAVTSHTKDFEGNYWFTTLHNGIFVASDLHFSAYEGLNSEISAIKIDTAYNRVWAGSIDKVFKLEHDKFTAYQFPDTFLRNEKVSVIYPLSKEKLLLGSGIGLFEKSENEFQQLFTTTVKDLVFDQDTMILGLSSRAEKIKGKKKIEFFSQRSICVLLRAGGKIWIGNNDGIHILDGKEHRLHPSINDTRINDLIETEGGTVWAASDVSGLFYITTDTVLHLREKEGLASDKVNKIALDRHGNCWAATNKGLSKIMLEDEKINIVNYTTFDGLSSNQINDLDIHHDTIWVATLKGVTKFYELQHVKPTVAPKIILNSCMVNGLVKSPQELLQLHHEENNILINYTGISFSSGHQLVYRYKTNKDQAEWQYTKNRSIELIDLNPGQYHFIVEAKNLKGAWSETLALPFSIQAPFYKTAWFTSLLLLAIAGSVLLLVQWRIRTIRIKSNIRHEMAELKQQALRAQMNPHFLFNTLNSIQSFFFTNEATKGHDYLQKFASLIRKILDNSEKSFLTLQEELEMLQLYLELESIRVKNTFTFKIEVAEHIDPYNSEIPHMLIQPFVENAIWHGINYLEESGYIHIEIQEIENEVLKVIIKDNGIGIDASKKINAAKGKAKPSSKGMKLINDRIKALNIKQKDRLVYEIKNNSPQGTIVELMIPIK